MTCQGVLGPRASQHPSGHRLDTRVVVVQPRDQVGHHLYVAPVLLLGAHGRGQGRGGVLDLGQPSPALGAGSFEVEFEGLHYRTDEIEGRLGEVAGRDEGGVETGFLEGGAYVVHVLDPHHRVVVGEGDTRQFVALRESDRSLRGELREAGGLVAGVGVRYLPVLATGAEDVAPVAAERKGTRARMEMEQRLLLDLVADHARRAGRR